MKSDKGTKEDVQGEEPEEYGLSRDTGDSSSVKIASVDIESIVTKPSTKQHNEL